MRTRWVLAGATALLYLVVLPLDFVAERASGWYAGSVTEFVIFQPAILATFVVGWLLVLRRVPARRHTKWSPWRPLRMTSATDRPVRARRAARVP